jgi:hypothetical protein
VRLLLAALVCAAAAPAAAELPPEARQLVLVRAAGWDATKGTLRRYRREAGVWKPVGGEARVSLGKSGLAWGRGLAPRDPARPPSSGPAKREGDGRTPAGAFLLTEATSIAATPPEGTRLRYRAAGDLVCVDDPASPHYNRIVPDGGDWRSAEQMDLSTIYRLVVNVGHNVEQVAGGGSCIFLHVWRRPGAATLGCTAMDGAVMETLLGWLDPAQTPVLVVLPDAAHRRLRASWKLP